MTIAELRLTGLTGGTVEGGWAEEPRSIGVEALLGCLPAQARQHAGGVTYRICVCVDSEYARVLSVGIAEPT